MDTTPGVTFAAQNHTQAWFAPSEQGCGLAIESLGLGVAGGGGNTELEFFATYIFDGSGAPRWVIGDKPNAASGNVALFTLDVNCPGCAHFADYGDTARAAGSLNIQYSARNSATLSTGITLPAPLSGNWTRNSLNIVPIADPQP
jgi:lysyl endopeptidase